MSKIKLEFEKGDVFIANLLEDEAPKTCKAIMNHLPFEYKYFHSIVSGHAILCLPPDFNVERENQRVSAIPPGTLSFLVKDDVVLVPAEIYISYGIFLSRGLTLDMKQPVNVFAQIEGDMNKLKTVCQRILMEGAETVKFTEYKG